MKKIFFFLLLCIIPFQVEADTMKHFEVLNGKLSLPFDPLVNTYTVYLIENETSLHANYTLKDETMEAKITNEEDKVTYTIMQDSKELEQYVFYLEPKEQVTSVFQESKETTEQKEIPNLHWYVISGCTIVILFLFKVLILGIKRKKHT